MRLPKMVVQEDFERYLDTLVKGKSILAIGETGMDFKNHYADLTEWRFGRLLEIADSLIGLDYNKRNALDASRQGFDFRHADVQDVTSMRKALGRSTFDVIILIDVIEHLSNTSLALESLQQFLKPNGAIVITTPTPWYFRDIQTVLFRGRPVMAPDHTQYVVPSHLRQLCERNDLRLIDDGAVHFLYKPSRLKRVLLHAIAWWNLELLNHYVFLLRKT